MQAWKASGDRLLRFAPQTRPDRPVDFTYDGHGNRIARTVPLPPKPELTEAEQRSQRGTDNLLRVMEVLTGTPKYEEPTEAPEVTKYRYDGSHQLIVIEHADGARSEYEYDALGRRVAKHYTQAGGARQTTLFMWDGDWMMQEVRSGRTPHEEQTVTYVPHPDHEGPLTRLGDGQAWHYVTDHLGTPQELYDEQREVVWAADLSAYGRTARRLAHAVDNPIRFPGQYYDRESGLHYNRLRYYDAEIGRYITQDPIGLLGVLGGSNHHSYADRDPVNRIDPSGAFAFLIPVALFVGRALGGAAVDAGVQLAKQKVLTGKVNWKCLDVADMAISGAFSAILPGLGASAGKAIKSAKAARALSGQLKTARSASKVAKLSNRIDVHKSEILNQVKLQGAIQGGKAVMKGASGCPASDDCDEEVD
ncbi:RHS repeat domain-containing protein [Burkholderia stabilis]|uniref:RHS repeat domain-containing protein n=1 Tax=Burkholderia stabilis TaxID=95485 RepID=UPI0024090CD7|nr:RHS repeat-associated core domain-containing protein [Burkholderia stabilis]